MFVMVREQIIERLTPLVREAFHDDTIVVIDSMSAENVASWTSLSFMQLLSKIEEQFAFKFRIFELLNIHNMGDLVSAIENHFSNDE